MSLDVVGLGALNIDKLYQVNKIAKEDEEAYIKDYTLSCGGSAANTIIGLSRLGLKTGYIGKVSNDPEGNLILDNLKNEDVNINGIIIEEGRTGNVMGYVDLSGQRALYVDPGVNDLIKPEEIKIEYLKDIKILHLTSFVGDSIKAQESLLEELPANVKVSFDPGRIYAEKGLEYIKKILNRTNILLVNEEELKLLTSHDYNTFEDRIMDLMDFEIDLIIVKRGDKGCYVTNSKESHSVEAFQVKCKDTTGAGDAFNAGFLYGLLKGKNLYNSCILGNYVAACCVEEIGSIKSLPYSSNINDNYKLKKNK
ncbi:MAG: carbohydrate kinase family protein [Methanobacterium sp.]|jgi:ribokinase